MPMSRVRWILLMLVAMLGTAALVLLYTRPRAEASQVEQDRQFEQMMTGVTLVGRSTTVGRDNLSSEERYMIESVTRVTGDTWLVQSRFQYETREVPIVIPVQVRWAGDTPVLCLTDFAIPGMGTFSARVVFYREQYAGTWSAQKYGGQMFGRLERAR
jgi:hypothetical protein